MASASETSSKRSWGLPGAQVSSTASRPINRCPVGAVVAGPTASSAARTTPTERFVDGADVAVVATVTGEHGVDEQRRLFRSDGVAGCVDQDPGSVLDPGQAISLTEPHAQLQHRSRACVRVLSESARASWYQRCASAGAKRSIA